MADKKEIELLSAAGLIKLAPWVLLGLVIIAGGMSSLIYGLPWARQSDVDQLAKVVASDHDDMQAISKTQAVTAEQQSETAAILSQIQGQLREDENNTQQNSLHIEGLEADEKARESAELAHRRGQ
ncbi:MAG: hypothetical protein WAU89_23290 [Candidatus Acidiferrales bacterium]